MPLMAIKILAVAYKITNNIKLFYIHISSLFTRVRHGCLYGLFTRNVYTDAIYYKTKLFLTTVDFLIVPIYICYEESINICPSYVVRKMPLRITLYLKPLTEKYFTFQHFLMNKNSAVRCMK